MIPLTLVSNGSAVRIMRIGGSAKVKGHLEDIGFVSGSEISVVSSLGGNVIVDIKGSRIALGSDMASRIMVV